jgi:hypothetical protein
MGNSFLHPTSTHSTYFWWTPLHENGEIHEKRDVDVIIMFFMYFFFSWSGVDGGKNTSQQRGSLSIPQVPIRLMNIWYGRPDGVMEPLPF